MNDSMSGWGEIIVVVIIASLLQLRISKPTLVLQKFTLNAIPRQAIRPTVEIVGRMQGIIAFILTLMGFSPITRFTIAGDELRCETTSVFGQSSQYIPLRCIATFAAGIRKPISAIIWAALFIISGLIISVQQETMTPLAVMLIIAIGMIVVYFLTKKFYIEVYAIGGPPIILLFKPNVIEGVPIDEKRALDVVNTIRDMILGEKHTDVVNIPDESYGDLPDANPFASSAIPDTASSSFETLDEYNDVNHQELINTVDDIEQEEDSELVAKELYVHARKLAKSGRKGDAIDLLKEIVRRFPHSGTADQARRTLQKSGI
ncbi:MAG: hypothetical protein O2955_15460 [Planctomycetota bacterium]|nr:hypothetical protein [Planctomycetota bacterium]MDA1213912.1 hypothetical protein [Planctomycetota bacterium]